MDSKSTVSDVDHSPSIHRSRSFILFVDRPLQNIGESRTDSTLHGQQPDSGAGFAFKIPQGQTLTARMGTLKP